MIDGSTPTTCSPASKKLMNPGPRSRFANETRRELDRRDETLRDGARLLAQRLARSARVSRIAMRRIAGPLEGDLDIGGGRANRDAACASAATDRLECRHLSELESFFATASSRRALQSSRLFRRIVGLFGVPAAACSRSRRTRTL